MCEAMGRPLYSTAACGIPLEDDAEYNDALLLHVTVDKILTPFVMRRLQGFQPRRLECGLNACFGSV